MGNIKASGGKLAKLAALDDAITAGMTDGVPGALKYIGMSTVKAVAAKPFSSLKDAALDSIDPAQWKYGLAQSKSFTGNVFQSKLGNMDKDLAITALTTIATSTGQVIKGNIMEKLFPKETKIQGIETPGGPPGGDDDALVAGLKGTLNAENLTGKFIDQVNSTVIAKLSGGQFLKASGWDEGEIAAFVKEYLKSTGQDIIAKTGEAAQEKRNARITADIVAKFKDVEIILGALPPDEKEFAAQYLQHYARNFQTGPGIDLAKEFKKGFTSTLALATKQSGKGTDAKQQQEYLKWVFSDPEKIKERTMFTGEQYTAANAAAEEKIKNIKITDEYKALVGEEKLFYDKYLADPNVMIGTNPFIKDAGINIKDDKAAWDKAYLGTKRAYARGHAGAKSLTWDTRKAAAFEVHVRSTDLKGLPGPIDPNGGETAGKSVCEKWTDEWAAKYDKEQEDKKKAKNQTTP